MVICLCTWLHGGRRRAAKQIAADRRRAGDCTLRAAIRASLLLTQGWQAQEATPRARCPCQAPDGHAKHAPIKARSAISNATAPLGRFEQAFRTRLWGCHFELYCGPKAGSSGHFHLYCGLGASPSCHFKHNCGSEEGAKTSFEHYSGAERLEITFRATLWARASRFERPIREPLQPGAIERARSGKYA